MHEVTRVEGGLCSSIICSMEASHGQFDAVVVMKAVA